MNGYFEVAKINEKTENVSSASSFRRKLGIFSAAADRTRARKKKDLLSKGTSFADKMAAFDSKISPYELDTSIADKIAIFNGQYGLKDNDNDALSSIKPSTSTYSTTVYGAQPRIPRKVEKYSSYIKPSTTESLRDKIKKQDEEQKLNDEKKYKLSVNIMKGTNLKCYGMAGDACNC